MKRLAKFGWTDIAIRKEKKLLILVCADAKQAKTLLEFLEDTHHYFTYKIGADFFKINLVVLSHGEYSVTIHAAHPNFSDIIDFDKYTFRLTTGALLSGGQLGYSKEAFPLRNRYYFPSDKRRLKAAQPRQPAFIIRAINMLQKAFHSVLQRKLS